MPFLKSLLNCPAIIFRCCCSCCCCYLNHIIGCIFSVTKNLNFFFNLNGALHKLQTNKQMNKVNLNKSVYSNPTKSSSSVLKVESSKTLNQKWFVFFFSTEGLLGSSIYLSILVIQQLYSYVCCWLLLVLFVYSVVAKSNILWFCFKMQFFFFLCRLLL